MTDQMEVSGSPLNTDTSVQKSLQLDVYVLPHCGNCDYARGVAENIATMYPQVRVNVIALDDPDVRIPETVFAVPTYLVDGRVWSLGNPSAEKIRETFGDEENAIGQ